MPSFGFAIKDDSGKKKATVEIAFSEAEWDRVLAWLESSYGPEPALPDGWQRFAMAVATRALEDAYQTERDKMREEVEDPPPVTPPEIKP